MTKAAVAYYRVSTQKQGISGLGLEAQTASVTAYAATHGLEVLEGFTEVETGTRKRQRPKLEAAIQAAKARGAVLLVAKIDRLARNVHFVSGLMESGVDFVAVDMPQANKLTIHLMAAMAEQEAELISTRTRDALKAAKARGVKLGTPGNLTHAGSLRSASLRREEARAAYSGLVVATAQRMKASGDSLRQIAKYLNDHGERTRQGADWSAVHVSRLLKRTAQH